MQAEGPATLHVNDLPDETLLAVLQCLTPQELLTAELVCQRWREVATTHHKALWGPLFASSPFTHWWQPYRPSRDFIALKEAKGATPAREFDYKWEYLTKSRCTERWLKFASFRRVGRGLRDHSEDYGRVIRWSRNEATGGGLGPARLAIRGLLVGGSGVGCYALASALGRLYPGVCISLEPEGSMDVLRNPLSSVQLVITREEQVEAEALLNYRREVGGTPFTFGPLPLELELEVADVLSVEGRSEIIRNELFESVRPTVILAAFSLEDFRSFNKLREIVLPAVRARFNDLPILLVGTKQDTRGGHYQFADEPDQQLHYFVSSASPSYQQGLEMAYTVGAKNYTECSILTREGLSTVVSQAAELGVRHMLQFFARTELENRPRGLQWEGQDDEQAEVHESILCNGCGVGPVVGNCYKCDTCLDYHLCETCFRGKPHNPAHTFKLWHTKKKRFVKRHTRQTTSFREGFRHKSSFTEEEPDSSVDEGSATEREGSSLPADLEEEASQQVSTSVSPQISREAAAEVRREKEEIKKKGRESFERTGLANSWKESVEDIFRMFSKSPDSKAKRKRTSSSSSSSSDGGEDLIATTTSRPASSSPGPEVPPTNKKQRTDE